MPAVIPYVPEQITVHLGPPNADAANVTLPFTDYVKNMASSEYFTPPGMRAPCAPTFWPLSLLP